MLTGMRIPAASWRRPAPPTSPNSRATARRQSGRPSRLESAALLVAVAAGAATVQPDAVGLSRLPGLLHVLSFRAVTALGLAATGVAVASRTGSVAPPAATRRAVAAGALLLAGAAHGVILARRGWARPGSAERADLLVVSLNTLNGAAAPERIVALVAAELTRADATMVALPETPEPLARQCAALLAAAGHPVQVFCTTADPTNPLSTTSLLVSERLGRYRRLDAPAMLLGAVLTEPEDGPGPVLAAVHPGAPMPAVGFARWRSDVTAAVGISRDHPFSVVAGDFNTTVDHAMMRRLTPSVDAATVAGRGAEGTWPAKLPAALAAPIDHVLLGGPFAVLGSRTERVGASDHRAVVVRLRLTDASPLTQSGPPNSG